MRRWEGMEKRVSALLLAAALMLSAAACGASRPAETVPAAAEIPTAWRIDLLTKLQTER